MEYFCDNHRHLICKPYSIFNLHEMAIDLGINRCWFHKKHKNYKHHYDIPQKRIEEIKAKCTLVSTKDILKMINETIQTTKKIL